MFPTDADKLRLAAGEVNTTIKDVLKRVNSGNVYLLSKVTDFYRRPSIPLVRSEPTTTFTANEALLDKAKHYSVREHGYSASLAPEGHHVYIAGIRLVHEYPQIELDEAGDALLEQPYRLSRTHQIVTLSFSRFGVGYTIDIECAKPMDDPRCTEDAYAIGIYESLALLATQGGAP